MHRIPQIVVDPELANLVLAIEDARFHRHYGVDGRALLRAALGMIIRRPAGGGSTIDMQLVRTITGRRELTMRRKVVEGILALRLRSRFGATHVLGAYLAIAYCGEGISGLEAASLRLFGHRAACCTRDQKAILAALLLHPIPRVATDGWRQRVATRAARALRRADAAA